MQSEKVSVVSLSSCASGLGDEEKLLKRNSRKGEHGNFSPNSAIFVFAVVFCIAQASWNFHLSNELRKVKDSVAAITIHCRNLEKTAEPRLQTFKTPEDEDSEYWRLLSIRRQRAFQNSIRKTLLGSSKPFTTEADSNESTHSISKRSAGKKSVKRKRASKKRCCAGNKAIAIHVAAQDQVPQGSQSAPIEFRGTTLTDWGTPAKTKFGTEHLLDDGYITVPKTGYYFVYSQVVFETTTLPYMVAEVGIKTMGSTIFSKCLFSKPFNATANSFITCSSNGIAKLKKSDGISLSVSPPGVKVFMKPSTTYFGALYIGK